MLTPKAFDSEEVSQVVVKLKDGSSWVAEYDSAGRLTPVRQLGEPPATPEPVNEETGVGSGKISSTAEEYFGKAEPKTMPMSRPRPSPEPDFDDDEDDEIPALPPEIMSDSVFRARLSSIMTDNMFDRNVKGRNRGKLDMKRLWKARTGATNLFMQKQARKNKQYNIVLLVDESGSMYGEKIRQAAETACFLAKSFDGLNLNLAIVGFNHFIMLHKSFDEKLPDINKLHETICRNAAIYGNGDNNDFEALAYGYKLFRGREGKNFLIMMSDGDPAQSGQLQQVLDNPKILETAVKQEAVWAVKDEDLLGHRDQFWVDTDIKLPAYQRAKRQHLNHLVDSHKNVTSIGIGVQSDCWQVPNHFREDDLDKLKPVLLREIKAQVTRG